MVLMEIMVALLATIAAIILPVLRYKIGRKVKPKIDLPLETWTDIFRFLDRSLLVKLVPHAGDSPKPCWGHKCRPTTIGDRQFVSFVQFYLHKCGQIKLGDMWTIQLARGVNVPVLFKQKWALSQELPLADTPIPENITKLQNICIKHFDASVLGFLQKFQSNSLITNGNLQFYQCHPDHPQLVNFLANVVALMNNIESTNIVRETDLLDYFQNEYSELAMPMLTSTRVLKANYNCRDAWFCEWLCTPRGDGKPRILCLFGSTKCSISSFIKYVKKDFMASNQAVSYFIHLYNFRRDIANLQSYCLDNIQTNERLVIKEVNIDNEHHQTYFMISRHPIGASEKWIKEVDIGTDYDEYCYIQISIY